MSTHHERRAGTFAGLIRLAPISLALAALLAIASAALSLLPFYLLYRMVVVLLAPAPDVSAVRLLALQAIGVIALRWLCMGLSHGMAHYGAFNILLRLRLMLALSLHRMPLSQLGRHGSGALRKTVLDDTGSLEGFLAHMLPDAIAAATVPLAALALLATVDWRMTLAAVAPLPLAILMQVILMRGAPERMARWQDLQSGIATQMVEYLRAMPVVKSFGLSAQSFGKLASAIHDVQAWIEKYVRISASGWAAFMALLSGNVVLVAPLGGWLWLQGEIGVPTLVLFLLVAPAVLQPLLRLTFALGEQARRNEALNRIGELLRTPAPESGLTAPPLATPHDIDFRHVDFRYEGRSGGALQDVSFTARAGQITALVGPSGAGKSTVVRLLAGLQEPSAGGIELAGCAFADWPAQERMGRIGAVFQEVFLFHGTIRENLCLARHDASDAELVAAAQAAQIHDFIVSLPRGYDTHIGELGGQLSGGERQRLSIARTLLKDAPVLLLDEVSAYADADNEWRLQQALQHVVAGRTVLMIAHRLHTVSHADHIVVLDGGRVSAQGRHEELLQTSALYRQLWADHEDARDWNFRREA